MACFSVHLCPESAQTLSFTAAFVTDRALRLQLQLWGRRHRAPFPNGAPLAGRPAGSNPSRKGPKSRVPGSVSSPPSSPSYDTQHSIWPQHQAAAQVGGGRPGVRRLATCGPSATSVHGPWAEAYARPGRQQPFCLSCLQEQVPEGACPAAQGALAHPARGAEQLQELRHLRAELPSLCAVRQAQNPHPAGTLTL